jgi:hypothetical protein
MHDLHRLFEVAPMERAAQHRRPVDGGLPGALERCPHDRGWQAHGDLLDEHPGLGREQ